MDKKMTYTQSIQIAIETLNAIDMFENFNDEQIGRIDAAVDRLKDLKVSLEKRNASKSEGPKAKADAEAKEAFKREVYNFVQEQDEAVRCGFVAEHFGVSSQKISAVLRKLADEGFIEKAVGEKNATVYGRIGLNG